ncbi:MAG: DNA-protecting protein DprA [Gammaproteobacteria bacterium]|nr:DNA-protecting protein DprA [Gammaproteobacteria bacterium]
MDGDREQLRAWRSVWLRLARRPRLDAAQALALLAAAGDPARIALPAAADGPALEADLRWLEGPARHLLAAGDPRYPRQLGELRGAPPVLFVDGDPDWLALPQIAIVGSRNASAAGRETAFEFAASLAAAGLVVTSGLAAGIDAAAHSGALAAGGATIAVCGTGLDRVYPAAHAGLAARIAARGALVSEFPVGTRPLPENFPRRNRLLSGLARGVLVVEAAARSGSLITARLAGEQGRDVMAIPGSIHDPLARGCHRLIRDGAALIETPADVLEVLGIPALPPEGRPATQGPDRPEISAPTLDSAGEMLLNALGFGPADIDRLVARTGCPAHIVVSLLQLLELRGLVESLPGGRYRRLPARQSP